MAGMLRETRFFAGRVLANLTAAAARASRPGDVRVPTSGRKRRRVKTQRVGSGDRTPATYALEP